MRYGCPVITSTVSSLPEVAGDAGILVNPDNVDELTRAMEKLSSDHSLRKNLSARIPTQLKKLSNSRQIKELIQLFT